MSSSRETYQLLEKIASSKIDDSSFPTHFNVVLRLRAVLGDPNTSFRKVIDILRGEPVVSAKVISTANTVGNSGMGHIVDVEKAVFRLGLNSVRRIALGIAMVQLNKSREMLVFSNLSRGVWLHTLYCSAAAFVTARELTTIHPEEAEFAGLLLNLGAFYMLYQAATLPEKNLQEEDVREGIARHYLDLTKQLLAYLELPSEIQEAMAVDKFQNIEPKVPPKTMRELIYVANELATTKLPWFAEEQFRENIAKPYLELTKAIETKYANMKSTFA